MLHEICLLFTLFLIYSFIGWVIEIIVCSICEKKFVPNRGFYIGPYCPIYGVAATMMILLLSSYKDEILVLFVMSFVLCTILEYITGVIMEKLFKARWWDYSHEKFNINGRVCLKNSLGFGILGVLLIQFINPFGRKMLCKIPPQVLIIIAILLMVIFIIDMIISTKIISTISEKADLLHLKDATNEVSSQVRETLSQSKHLTKRLLNAFPKANTKDNSFTKLKQYIDHQIKENKTRRQVKKETRSNRN